MSFRFFPRLVTAIACLGLVGCAGLQPAAVRPVEPAPVAGADSRAGWWSVRLQWQWPEGTEPAWHLDLFAAHQIFLPLLNTHADALSLWRFHRRAVRDAAGHQFSLIFYASAPTAGSIYGRIAADPLIASARAAEILLRVETENVSASLQSGIADTSDPAWSPAMQAAWPYYIFGVSRMWLHLVADAANEAMAGTPPATVAETAAFYRQVDAEITRVWQEEGRHAMLHHLNALFGYQPIPIVETHWLTF